MVRGPLLYQGKSKAVFSTDDPSQVIVSFTDRATAFNAKKKADVQDKGLINCTISRHLFGVVAQAGIAHHVIGDGRAIEASGEPLGAHELLCHAVEIVPIEVVVRNRAAGSFSKRYRIEEGMRFEEPLVELFYKSDALDDPLIVPDAAVLLGYAKRWEIAFLTETALSIHRVLQEFWATYNIELVDAKYEFGRAGGRLLLADELTPDGARLWEIGTGRRFDKDVFRRDLGDLGETYRALYAKLFGSAARLGHREPETPTTAG